MQNKDCSENITNLPHFARQSEGKILFDQMSFQQTLYLNDEATMFFNYKKKKKELQN